MAKTRANFVRKYLWRYIFIALVGFGWAIYCAYDGFYAYPKKLVYSEAYFGIETEDPNDDGERNKIWKKLVEEKVSAGEWPKKLVEETENNVYPKKEPKKIKQGIYFSIGTGALALIFAIPNLLLWFTNARSWIELDGKFLTTSWGQSFDLASVKVINKNRWEKKGICVIEYDEKGSKRIFVLDDFKYDREPCGIILRAMEDVAGKDKILGGKPESDGKPASDASSADSSDD